MSDNKNNKNSEENGKLLDHNYDGIQELDNNLPRWWVMLFYFTVVFGGVYYVYYEFGGGQSIKEEYAADIAAVETMKMNAQKTGGFPDSAKLAAVEKNADAIGKGKVVYQARCVSCHADKGQGLVGPNLTDNFWINGNGTLPTIAQVIHDGVGAKGMPPWGPVLTEDELYQVTAFVASLKGTNPAGAKPAQGTEYKN